MSLLMHRSMLIQIILGGLLLFWVAQCDQGKPIAPRSLPTGSIHIEVSLADGALGPDAAPKVVVTQGRLRVSGEGMVARDTLLTVQGGRLAGQLDQVPVGLRQVGMVLLGASQDTLWQGETDVTVVANATATATIRLERVDDQAPQASFSVSPELGGLRTVFRYLIVETMP